MNMHDLRYYISACRLTEMRVGHKLPERGHKSHKNNLQVFAEPWRRLEGIHELPNHELSQRIRNCTTLIPGVPVKLPSACTIPCPLLVHSNEARLGCPMTITGMISWIKVPLETTQCAMHAAFPEAVKNHRFYLVDDPQDLDKDLFRVVSWSNRDSGMTRLVIAFQPPWILSDKDIMMFQQCASFPPFKQMGDAFPISEKLASCHRLWAKVYDLCIKRQTHWFVLTSYNGWVFGAFSPGWTHAFVTRVFGYNAHDPTIAQLLMYWVGSAMHLPHFSAIPDHPEPVQNIITPIRVPNRKVRIDYGNVKESESHWDGKSDEAPSSAGLNYLARSDLVSSMSNDPSPPGNTAEYGVLLRHGIIKTYVAKQQQALPPEDPQIIPRGVERSQLPPTNTPMGDWLV